MYPQSHSLHGMTQAKWSTLSQAQRMALQDLSGLHPLLIGLEGWRVEVTDTDGAKRRFIVGRSAGWQPCHIEIKTTRSIGGFPAARHYTIIRKIAKIR